MKMKNDETRMTNETDKRTSAGCGRLASWPFHSSFVIRASSFSVPRTRFQRLRRQSGFSLVEILIALFVFLVGVLGVLSIFPVAMNSASRSTGEVRATILSQNAIAQMMADCQADYEKDVCSDAGNDHQLVRLGGADRVGFFVTLTSGSGKGQSRLICEEAYNSGTGKRTMSVVPDWTTAPAAGDGYVVTRLGLPWDSTDTGDRRGYVREIGDQRIYAGKENLSDLSNPQVDALTTLVNCAPPAPVSCTAAGGSDDFITGLGVTWGIDAYRGWLMRITEDVDDQGPAVGQVRWVTRNSANTLDLYPPLAVEPDWTKNVKFEICRSLGYFLVITSGRATGRIFRITGYDDTDARGDQIICDGVDFNRMNVKAAKQGASYPMSNADSFMIIGGPSTMLTAFPAPPTATTAPYYVFNSFGRRNTAERQAGQDLFVRNAAEKDASDFDFVGIFSPRAVDGGPVRVDIFVFRNYDSAKTPQANQRPVGYMTGYIGRPKP